MVEVKKLGGTPTPADAPEPSFGGTVVQGYLRALESNQELSQTSSLRSAKRKRPSEHGSGGSDEQLRTSRSTQGNPSTADTIAPIPEQEVIFPPLCLLYVFKLI